MIDVRVFDDATKRSVYASQTKQAEANSESNCPLCAIGHDANFTLSIGLLSFIARQTAKNLQHRGYEIDQLNQFWVDSQAFILMAAIVYVIATIFKKGIELQNENELTI